MFGLQIFQHHAHMVNCEWRSKSGESTTPPLTTYHVNKLKIKIVKKKKI